MSIQQIKYYRRNESIANIYKENEYESGYNIFWPYSDVVHPYEIKLIKTGLFFFLPNTMAGIIFKGSTSEKNVDTVLNIWTKMIHGDSSGELEIYLENISNKSFTMSKNDILCKILFVSIEKTIPIEIFLTEADALTKSLNQMVI